MVSLAASVCTFAAPRQLSSGLVPKGGIDGKEVGHCRVAEGICEFGSMWIRTGIRAEEKVVGRKKKRKKN